MAIIGKIREKSGLVVTIVGIGLFLFIVPLDKIIQQFSGGSAEKSDFIFNGEEQSAEDWKLNEKIKNQTLNSPRLDEITKDFINVNTFEEIIKDTILKSEINKLGINVSKNELNEGILNGTHPIPSDLKNRYKTDSIFDISGYTQELNQITNSDQINMLAYEVYLKNNRKKDKYNSMVKYGVLGTYEEEKRDYIEKNTENIDFI